MSSDVYATGVDGTDVQTSSNMVRISAKLFHKAFQTFPDVSFFEEEKKNRQKFRISKFVFRQFDLDFDEPQPNGPQNQLPR